MSGTAPTKYVTQLAMLSCLTSATVWGLIWYPFRLLNEWGVTGTWSSLLTYVISFLVAILILKVDQPIDKKYQQMTAINLAIALFSGLTNIGFVWATVNGEIMRVILLFYLMPVWTLFFAWFIVGEVPQRKDIFYSLLSLSGALLMLWKNNVGIPTPQSAAEWVGLGAGISFAISNTLSRRAADMPAQIKARWVLGGCAVVGLLIIPFEPNAFTFHEESALKIVVMLCTLGIVMAVSAQVVQFGLSHLASNTVAVLFLFEIVVAGVSAWLLAGEALNERELCGATMIVLSSLMASVRYNKS
jgi:drug/metabolite transporter (DMT)-like permease